MFHRRFAAAAAATLLSLALTACASGPSQEDAPTQVDDMVSWIERVHVEADRSRLSVAESYERLQALAKGKFGNETAATSFARLVQSTDAAEQQSQRFREAVGPMQESAALVFQQWQQDVAKIQNERLRQRSETRLAVAKERYDAIAKVAVPAQAQLEAYVKTLRDHTTFLAHDLNTSALDEIQSEVTAVARLAENLDRSLDACLAAARSYVERAALPAAPPPQPAR